MIFTFDKKEGAVTDFSLNWKKWLKTGETLSSYTIAGDSITIDTSNLADSIVSVRVSGGTAGDVAGVTIIVTSSTGRKDPQDVKIRIID